MECMNCPRGCVVDRVSRLGFCHASLVPEVSSVSIHKGEEPPLCGKKGVCNVFFAHCNLQCLFCQNNAISRGVVDSALVRYCGVDAIVRRIEEVLPQCENVVGLVSPTHYVSAVPQIVERLHADGFFPTIVYNTGGYDTVEALRMVEPYVDVYLPDYKYSDAALARRYSSAGDYPQAAANAIMEMYRQKGSGLMLDDEGMAFRGLIVRHLVLPGAVDNSIGVLDWLADNLPLNLHVSLMSQYFPPDGLTLPDQLCRTIHDDEYKAVVDHFYALGFSKGWVQELDSQQCFRPDFSKSQSFSL